MVQKNNCIFGCKTFEILHRFPKPAYPNLERFNNWKRAVEPLLVGRDNFDIYSNCRICSQHFEKKLLFPKTNRLAKSAIPTLRLSADNTVLQIFPNPEKELIRFETWVHAIGGNILSLDRSTIFENRRVCRVHFESRYHTRNKRLSPDAVPTLLLSGKVIHNLSRPKHVDHTYTKSYDDTPSSPEVRSSITNSSAVDEKNPHVVSQPETHKQPTVADSTIICSREEENINVNSNGNVVYLPEAGDDYHNEDNNLNCSEESADDGNGTVADINLQDVKNICRTCLVTVSNADMVNLEQEILLDKPVKLIEMLVSLGCILDFGDDNWPHSLCKDCTISTTLAYRFKEKCQYSTNTLLKHLTEKRSLDQDPAVKLENVEQDPLVNIENVERDPAVNIENVGQYVELRETLAEFVESYEPEVKKVKRSSKKTDHKERYELHPVSEEVRQSIRCTKVGCDKKFAKVTSLIHHMALHHPEERPFICDMCSKGLVSEKYLMDRILESSESPKFQDDLKENRKSDASPICKGCGLKINSNKLKEHKLQPS